MTDPNRETFENWAREEMYGIDRCDDMREYQSIFTEHAWQGFQAAMSLRLEVSDDAIRAEACAASNSRRQTAEGTVYVIYDDDLCKMVRYVLTAALNGDQDRQGGERERAE